MNYFFENERVDVAAFQLSYVASDGKIYGVKHTERVIEGDYTIERGQNIRGVVYYKIVPTDQLYERLKTKGFHDMGYDNRRFLTQEELDTYINKTVVEVEFKNDELKRLKQVV